MLFNTGKEKNIPNVPVYVLEEGSESSVNLQQVIQPGDRLFLRNLQDLDLVSGTGNTMQISPQEALNYKVELDSTAYFPIIGKVKLAGLTRTDAEIKLNELYRSNLLNAPIITLTITNLKVSLLGEFTKQGTHILNKEQIHLIDVVGDAGGLTNRANKKRIKIIRGSKINPQVLSVNLEDVKSLSDPRLFLKRDDIVYAEPKGLFNKLDQISPITAFISVGLTIVNTLLLINNLNK